MHDRQVVIFYEIDQRHEEHINHSENIKNIFLEKKKKIRTGKSLQYVNVIMHDGYMPIL